MNPFDQFDAKQGGNPFDQFDAKPSVVPITIGAQNFADAMKAELEGADPFKKGIAAFGVGASDLVQRIKQLFGSEDRSTIEANKMIRQESPLTAVAGDLAMTAIPLSKVPFLRGATTVPKKIAQYAGNVGIGAATGAGLAQLRPDATVDSTLQGAGEGAFGAGVIAPAITGGLRVAGGLYDIMRGAKPSIAAGKVLRDAAGGDLEKIKAAMASAPDDLTAAQAAFGIDKDTWAALGELAKRGDKDSFYRVLADRQAKAQRDIVSRVAGGQTQTEALASREGAKKSLNKIFTPNMERELAAANEGRKALTYQAQADALGDAAAAKVADVRRFENAKNLAEDSASAFGRRQGNWGSQPPTGMPSAGGRNSYQQELASRAEKAASDAAAESLILGEGSRFSKRIADSLEAYGMKPLDVNPIVANIRSKINNPSAAGNDDYAKVLGKVADDIQEWAQRGGGVIDSRALYAIRKNSVNNAITNLTGKADPKAAAKFEAQVLSDVRPMIDKAIEEAGGTGWKATLKIFEDGMKEVNQQKMGGKLLELFDKSKKNFAETVKGNTPKDVQKVFGYGEGSGDIAAQMGEKIKPLRRVADEVERDRLIAERGAGASNALADILERDAMKFRFPSLLRQEATIANKGLDIIEGQINRKTKAQIVEAMKSGKNALEAINTLPTSEKDNVLKLLMQYSPQASVFGTVEMGR